MILWRYALSYVGFTVALMLLSLALKLVADVDFANGGMALIPAIGAAMIEGQKYVQTHSKAPEAPAMWRFARMGAAVALAISMVVVALSSFVVPEIRALMSQQMGAGLLLGMLLLQAGLTFLVTRFFIGLSARSQLAAKAKKQR